MDFINYLLSALIGYLIGSLSFGIIFSKIKYKKDVRDFGSKNAGMTNTLRTFGKGAAAVVFIGDVLKGVAAVLIAKYLIAGQSNVLICAYTAALFAVIGHMFPAFFKFKGGKGAATAIAVTTTLAPLTFPILAVPFFILAFTTKMVSVASIVSSAILPVATFFIYYFYGESPTIPTIFTSIMAIMIIFMHRGNIKRIIKGEENKFSSKKKTV
ncbi:MAG: glycerol-3-phosphate 1-O-acyltransferase PlsY [Oscillospiraceae bacterium]